MHQGKPRIGPGIAAPRHSAPVRARGSLRAYIRIHLRVLGGTGIAGNDDVIPDLLRRRHSLAFAHAPGDILHLLHKAVEPRATERNLAATAVENSSRQRALERQHRKHPFLDGTFRNEIDDLHGRA